MLQFQLLKTWRQEDYKFGDSSGKVSKTHLKKKNKVKTKGLGA
jgi:hypothetical protein